MSDLDERVFAFVMMRLPGQPQSMHMGTKRLVMDLNDRVNELEKALFDRDYTPDDDPHGINAEIDRAVEKFPCWPTDPCGCADRGQAKIARAGAAPAVPSFGARQPTQAASSAIR